MGLGGTGDRRGWSVFDGLKNLPPTPEALMAEIDNSIAALECAHATAHLRNNAPKTQPTNTNAASSSSTSCDLRLADDAYRSACAALASGKLELAFHSLRVALANCPPEKTSALAKINSLISITSQQLQKPT